MDNFYMSSVTPLFFGRVRPNNSLTPSPTASRVAVLPECPPREHSESGVNSSIRPNDCLRSRRHGDSNPWPPSHVSSLEPHKIDDSYFSLYSIRSIQ